MIVANVTSRISGAILPILRSFLISDEDLAYKMLTWAWHMDQSALRGMTDQQFAKYALLQLGRGQNLIRIVKGGRPRRIAPTEEVFALTPNLQPPRS